MASAGATEPGAPVAVPQVCPHCRKSFPRLCDLNKHAKSHSRPFKCSVPSCKYHQHGWPTAKELERHVNDKHSLAPRTYACAFESCTYESKRESNCKQHMEKKHGWEYVRSKSNGKRLPAPQCVMTQLAVGPVLQTPAGFHSRAEATPQITPVSPKPQSVHEFGGDFILFPGNPDQPIVLGQPDEDLGPGYDDAHHDGDDHDDDDESRVFIPWEAPATRMLKNQSMLDMFTETYNRAPEKELGHSDAMIDPTLQHFSDATIANWQRFEGDRVPVIDTSVKAEPNLGMDRFSWNGGSDTGSAPDDSPSDRRNPSTAYSSQYHTPHSAAVDFTGPPAHPGQMGWNKLPSRRRGSDEDSQRPEKKLKSSPAEEFTDNNMPDIFRFAHPRIYDRDQREKYSPCHSSHRDISTLVRHLGRPAHRLTVTKEAISSFDIGDEDYPHPRVGICRRCWRQFEEREAFDEHAAGSCDKVSKGKREKWQILHDSFTPLVDRAVAVDNIVQPALEIGDDGLRVEPMHSPNRPGGFLPSAIDGATWSQPPASPGTAMSSPTAYFHRRSAAPTSAPDHALISAQEYERLQKEHNDLQKRAQQLERILAERSAVALGGARQGGHLALHTGTLPGAVPLVSGAPRAPAAGSRPNQNGALPDRDNLVLHMGSQPEEVDVEGLMNEPQEKLSRQNSGMTSSSSRSTIHHVTTSPPQRLAVDFEEGEGGKGGDPAKAATPNRKPLPSIPDSGYSSTGYRRHGSFGDIGHMPGGLGQHDHHRSNSNMSALSFQHHGKPHATSGHNEVLHSAETPWGPTQFTAPTSAPLQGAAAQDQQAQTHTFLPGQNPAQGEGMEDFFHFFKFE